MGGRRLRRSPKDVEALIEGLGERGLLQIGLRLCTSYGVRLDDVLYGRGSVRVVRARDALAHALLGKGFSTVEAGMLLGMHHTSIIAARNRYEKRDMGRLLT